MSDRISTEQRSRNMARVRNKNTAPEMIVRKTLHRLGYRFRLHRRDLPGSPDIVLPRHRAVIFVHGCFWHGHDCRRGKRPTSHTDCWTSKLDRTIERDRKSRMLLQERDWKVLVVWECQVWNPADLDSLLLDFLNPRQADQTEEPSC